MRASVNGVRLWFEVSALQTEPRPEGAALVRPAVLAVHGGPGSGSGGAKQALQFLTRDAQVVFYDQRGHGRSDYCDSRTWNLDSWSSDLVALCQGLELDIDLIVGISFGGMVAARALAMCPNLARGLCLMSTYPRFRAEGVINALLDAGESEAPSLVNALRDNPSTKSVRAYRSAINQLFERNPATAAARDHSRQWADERLEVYEHFVTGELLRMDLRKDLSAIKIPTLLLAGALDPLVPSGALLEMRDAIGPTSTVDVIPEAGHLLSLDAPTATESAIRRHLQHVLAGSGA